MFCNIDEFSILGVDIRGSGEFVNFVKDISMSLRFIKIIFVGCIFFLLGCVVLICGVFLVFKEC